MLDFSGVVSAGFGAETDLIMALSNFLQNSSVTSSVWNILRFFSSKVVSSDSKPS